MKELSANNDKHDIIVYLKPGLDSLFLTQNTVSHLSSDDKARMIHQHLVQVSSSSQAALLRDLMLTSAPNAQNLVTERLWISNAMVMHGVSSQLIHVLDKHPMVKKIVSDKAFKADIEKAEQDDNKVSATAEDAQWNIKWVKATDMWDLGFQGNGITVANADTGVQFNHTALFVKYRGYSEGQEPVHEYNWFDAIKKPIGRASSKCGYDVKYPCDDQGHGTHCMGTECGGSTPKVATIGVAPKANWIACRNMDAGTGRPSTYIGCLQFFLAPTDLKGNNPDTDRRPDVVSNSYGCPSSEKCEIDSLLEAVIALRAAGIFMAVANGNSGPSCSTTYDPPGNYEQVFSIGALGRETDKIAYFSSRGPGYLNVTKPDLSAPGSSILSSVPGNSFSSLSGTSMATPHVAGAVALLWEAVPALRRNIDATEKVLIKGAKPMKDDSCGPGGIPNNVYGHGNMNILESYKIAKAMFSK